ncbi:hypothetical protein B0T16DRAFT_408382 [Cercophora newfieldiana]|uniref:Uncharacterized protein n=1 Tax=Cercophora newfieldiana TaxID=92897 RepID=A0AA39Y9I5_9PEZI|nr:hypothetical protein B0T16DRAFT_408382 [Cercophora newfieldiana]
MARPPVIGPPKEADLLKLKATSLSSRSILKLYTELGVHDGDTSEKSLWLRHGSGRYSEETGQGGGKSRWTYRAVLGIPECNEVAWTHESTCRTTISLVRVGQHRFWMTRLILRESATCRLRIPWTTRSLGLPFCWKQPSSTSIRPLTGTPTQSRYFAWLSAWNPNGKIATTETTYTSALAARRTRSEWTHPVLTPPPNEFAAS